MPRFQGGGGSIGIWDCIAGSSTGLAHLYTDQLNQHWYREILENYLQLLMDIFEAGSTWQFQQDNAPFHNQAIHGGKMIEADALAHSLT